MFTDRFGRRHTYLRIALTERCNLRCRYCMPAEGVALSPRDEILTFEEIERLAALFVRHGIDKIRLTGGEPLVRREVELLVERLAALPGSPTLALTTNGLLLPKKLPRLHAAGLGQLNISLDTIDPERFAFVTRRQGLEVVLRAIDMALEYDYEPLKINCVVMRGFNDDEIPSFVEMTRERSLDVRFIEYMPFAGNGWEDGRLLPYADMITRIEEVYPALQRLDDPKHATSKAYQVPGFRGKIGFITSMSDNFCAGCNRLRITADGNLKVCLFGNAEVSLRDVMRAGATDDELVETIQAAVLRKKAAHAGKDAIARSENRPMILIGG